MKRKFFLVLTAIFIAGYSCSPDNRTIKDSEDKHNPIPENAIPVIYADYIHLQANIGPASGSFLLDTGFDNLSIDSIFYYSNNLNYLNSSGGRIFGIGNTYQKLHLIKDTISFSFGSQEYLTSFVPILNLKPIGGDFVDGLIGTKHFGHNVLELNYYNEYFRIHKSIDSVDISGYNKAALKESDNRYFMPVIIKINDSTTITGNFLIDTATPGTSLTSLVALTNNLNNKTDCKVPYYTMYGGIGGESSGFDFKAESVTIAGLSLNDVILSYSLDTAGSLASQSYCGILGNDILDHFNLIFDFKNCNLYLKPNANFNEPYSFNKLGFSYVDRCKTMGGWIVAGLYRNSPAEREGLRIDDKIISVNKIPVEKIGYADQSDFFEKIDKVEFIVSRVDGDHTFKFVLSPLLEM